MVYCRLVYKCRIHCCCVKKPCEINNIEGEHLIFLSPLIPLIYLFFFPPRRCELRPIKVYLFSPGQRASLAIVGRHVQYAHRHNFFFFFFLFVRWLPTEVLRIESGQHLDWRPLGKS